MGRGGSAAWGAGYSRWVGRGSGCESSTRTKWVASVLREMCRFAAGVPGTIVVEVGLSVVLLVVEVMWMPVTCCRNCPGTWEFPPYGSDDVACGGGERLM